MNCYFRVSFLQQVNWVDILKPKPHLGRKEGDKYAADFDETAHFLDQYCSCLLKQTEARSEMIKKVNSTMFQMEKAEETIKTQDKVNFIIIALISVIQLKFQVYYFFFIT